MAQQYAHIGSTSGTVISVNAADKPKLDEMRKNLVKALNPEKEKQAAPKQDDILDSIAKSLILQCSTR